METEKTLELFNEMVVNKGSVTSQFASLSIPAFIRDWFIRRYSDNAGNIDVKFIADRIKVVLPRKDDWNGILDKMMSERKTVKFLARILATIDIKTNTVTFSLPDFGVENKNTLIEADVWDDVKEKLLQTLEPTWGVVELAYKTINNSGIGKIVLKNFQSFRPYDIDLKYYKKARESFSLDEWIDLLLGAIDYNADGFKTQSQKLAMLKRLLPFVEKRLNLIELAPKGTGKSYLFSQISKRGWLASGGVMTRAKMFYDMQKKQEGLVSSYDYVALDEIATIKFPDVNEMQGAMKGYLESGAYTVGIKSGSGNAGVVLLGNIDKDKMNTGVDMFSSLSNIFHDSALIDRFHGFIEGWEIPRMNEEMKVNGWALNCEYFAEILHALRDDISYNSLLEKLLVIPKDADTRDVTAVKRMTAAYMKLLFPHWQKLEDVDKEAFYTYCLEPAKHMRGIIKTQLGIIDAEYAGKTICDITVKD